MASFFTYIFVFKNMRHRMDEYRSLCKSDKDNILIKIFMTVYLNDNIITDLTTTILLSFDVTNI